MRDDVLTALKLALQLIEDTWIKDHGNEQVGNAWGALVSAIHTLENDHDHD